MNTGLFTNADRDLADASVTLSQRPRVEHLVKTRTFRASQIGSRAAQPDGPLNAQLGGYSTSSDRVPREVESEARRQVGPESGR